MVTRISSEARKALEAMDWVERGMPENTEEQIKLLLEYNRIVKLLSIGPTLKEGWGKFIYNEAVNRFGDDADFRIRNSRKELFKSLAGKSENELKKAPERLRAELLESSMSDVEKPTRHTAAELFEKLFSTQDYRSLKLNFFSNVPLNLLAAGDGRNVFSVGEFYVDDKAVDLFVGLREAYETITVVGEALSYVRSMKTGWKSVGELRGEKKAALYAKNLYKLFHKNLKEESLDKGLDEIVDNFNAGLLVKGLLGLRNHPNFEATMKNMTNVVVVEFEKGATTLYTANMKGVFLLDDAGAENIRNGLKKYDGIAASYIFAMDMILNYFTAIFNGMDRMVFDRNLRLCHEEKNSNEPGRPNAIQALTANIFATAAANDVLWLEGRKPVGQATIGVRAVEFLFPETLKRLNVGFFGETPSGDIKLNSLIYSDATLIYPETGVSDYNLYVSPQISFIFGGIDPNEKFDAGLAERLNSVWPVGMEKPPFKYEKGKFDSIVCSLSPDLFIVEAEEERRVKK